MRYHFVAPHTLVAHVKSEKEGTGSARLTCVLFSLFFSSGRCYYWHGQGAMVEAQSGTWETWSEVLAYAKRW